MSSVTSPTAHPTPSGQTPSGPADKPADKSSEKSLGKRVRTLLSVAVGLLGRLVDVSGGLSDALRDVGRRHDAAPWTETPKEVMAVLGFDLHAMFRTVCEVGVTLSLLAARFEWHDLLKRNRAQREARREKQRLIATGLLAPPAKTAAEEEFDKLGLDRRYMPPKGDWSLWGVARKRRERGPSRTKRWAELCRAIEGRTDEDVIAEICEKLRLVARALGEPEIERWLDRCQDRLMDLVSGDAAWSAEQSRSLGLPPTTDWPSWADDEPPLPRRRE